VTNVDLTGVRVLVVEDELIEHAGFDVAILDVNLNGQETYPIADALIARAIPFVFATGYSTSGLRREYRSIPLLQKPFQRNELERALASALSRRAAQ
jgi:CheY-like chemotaxis protein